MSDSIYEVQKVLEKKVVNRQIYYFLKWKGYGKKDNCWVRAEKTNCPDLIEDFEKNRMAYVLAVRRHNNNIDYLMQTKKNAVEIISSAEARQFWATLIIDFLEKCVTFNMPCSQNGNTFGLDDVENEVNVDVQNITPIRIAYFTKQVGTGTKFYLAEFDGGVHYVKANEAKRLWPNLIIDYLEPLIKFD